MSAENKVPAIRFEGVSGEWKDKRIQGLINEQAIISHLDGNHGELYPRPSEFSDEGIPYIGANDFSNGFVNFTRCKHLPISRAKQFKKGIAKDGDVLFAHNATVGPVAKLETDLDFVILSTTATYFRCDNDTLINDYLLQVLSGTKFVKQYSRVMSQSTRNQVPITIQRTFFISIPKDPTEQTKIGNYFQQLETLIVQHQQKHGKLLNLKKSLLEKMFPKQGATEPEIRFKGFSGEWEVKALGENADLLTGNPFNSKSFSKEGVFLVRGMNVKRGYLATSDNISEYWSSSHGLEKYLLRENDIVIQMDGALIGKSYATIKNKHLPALLVQRVTRIRSMVINSEFTYQCIQKDFLKHISKIKTETAVPHLSLNDIRNFKIFVPKKEEQTKIGNLFKQLDTLLTQHQAQLKKLNNIKQACLEKMFV